MEVPMFQVLALEGADFSHFYDMSDEALKGHGIVPVIADAYPGYPCRVSLAFAPVGSRLLLMNYQHHTTQSPFASNYAIYVRDGAISLDPEPGELPPVFQRRSPIAVRAFDKAGMLKSAEIVDGPEAGEVFNRLLDNEEVSYLHAHYAAYGCFAAKVVRGWS
jgi:hypothetical protein